MVICLIALGAVWVVLKPAPVVQTAKEPPVKKTLAYHDAMAARDQEIGKKSTKAVEPSSVEGILADGQASPQDGGQDLAALPDGAPAEPLPWAQPGNTQAGTPPQGGNPPQAGYPPQAPYGQPQYPGADPYGQNAPAKQNSYDRNTPGQNPYAANVPGSQDANRQKPPADPYGAPAPGQTAYPGQAPYGQVPYGQNPYGNPEAPYGRAPYSQDPYGSDGQPTYEGQSAHPGQDPYGASPTYPGQAQPPYPGQQPYPGQAQAALPPEALPQGAQPQGQYPGQAPYGAAQEEWVRVIGSGTGMRNSASEDSPVLFAFPYGRSLKVLSRNGEWVEVSDPNSSAKGWMQAHALAPTAGPNTYVQQPYFEEPREERQGPLRSFINGVFGN